MHQLGVVPQLEVVPRLGVPQLEVLQRLGGLSAPEAQQQEPRLAALLPALRCPPALQQGRTKSAATIELLMLIEHLKNW